MIRLADDRCIGPTSGLLHRLQSKQAMHMVQAQHGIELSVEDEPCAQTIAALRSGIDAYNAAIVGPDHSRKLAVIARDKEGQICGGIYGKSYWSWLFIEFLWVASSQRGSGLGSRLLQQAEQEAVLRDCTGVYLNTISFQAPAFYEARGYREFGRLPGMPPGHDRIWLAKRLDQVAPSRPASP